MVSLNAPWLILGHGLLLLNILYLEIPCDDSHDKWWYLWIPYIDAIIHSYIVSHNVLSLDLGRRVILLGAE